MKGQCIVPDFAARETYLRWGIYRNVYGKRSRLRHSPVSHNEYPWLSQTVLTEDQVREALARHHSARVRQEIREAKSHGPIDPSIFDMDDFDEPDPVQPPVMKKIV